MSPEERFVEAFSAALYDVALERAGHEIYHFFDADFLHRIIFGFRDPVNQALMLESQEPRSDGVARQRLLMSALVGQRIGAPPNMRALLPHLYEVRLAVGSANREMSESADAAIDLLGLRTLLQAVLDDLDSSGPDAVLDRLLEDGPALFYGLELFSGSWPSRLGRVLELKVENDTPFQDATDFDPALLDIMASYVGQGASDVRAGGAASGLRDAMALSMLALLVDRTNASTETEPFARFYTETPRIERAWGRSQEFRDLLTYQARPPGLTPLHPSAYGAFRTSEYYLLRVLIPELGYAEARPPTLGDAVPRSFFEVGDMFARAADTLREAGITALSPSRLPGGGREFRQYVADVTDVSSYGYGWQWLMGSAPPHLPQSLVTQVKDVVEGQRRLTPALKESFQRHLALLSARTSEIASHVETYGRLLDAFGHPHTRLRPNSGGYIQHYGLLRWGFGSNDVDELALQRFINEYEDWSAQPDHSTHAASGDGYLIDLTRRLHLLRAAVMDGPSRSEGIALLGFLWLLGDFKSVAKFGETVLDGIAWWMDHINTKAVNTDEHEQMARIGGGVENMTAAAKLRAALSAGRVQPSEMKGEASTRWLTSVQQSVRRLESGERQFACSDESRAITQGYLLFHIWQALNRDLLVRQGPGSVRVCDDLASESLDVCLSVLDIADTRSPLYPVLINHCLYVAIVTGCTGGRSDLETNLAQQLARFAASDNQAWWDRFDDTMGYYYYLRAARAIRMSTETKPPQDKELLAASARKDVSQASRWFDRIEADPDDDDVIAHRALLRELESELEQLETGPIV